MGPQPINLLERLAAMDFAHRLAAVRKQRGMTQQTLADTVGVHVTQLRRYEAGNNQPTLDVLRALAVSADDLVFDPDERGPQSQTSSSGRRRASTCVFDPDERGPQSQSLRLKLGAVDQFTPDEQEHVAAFIEGALLRHHARQAFSGQAS